MSLSEQFPWLAGVEGFMEDVSEYKNEAIAGLLAPYMTDTTMAQRAVGNAETLAGTAYNMGNTAAQGLGALTAAPYGLDNATNALKQNLQDTTYQPKSMVGQSNAGALGQIMAPVEAAREGLGEEGMKYGPAMATAGYIAPDVAMMLTGTGFMKGAKRPQAGLNDLFPDSRALPAPKGPGLFDVEGVMGRGGPGKMQEGAVKITGRDPVTGKEIYEKRTDRTIPAVRPVYESPKIDIDGKIIDQPKDAPAPLFRSVMPLAFQRSKTKEATPAEWREEFNAMGVPEQELKMSGVHAKLQATKPDSVVKREELVGAYNDQASTIETWNTGGGVVDPARPAKEKQEIAEAEFDSINSAVDLHAIDLGERLAGALDLGDDPSPVIARMNNTIREIAADAQAGVWTTYPTVEQTNIPDDIWNEAVDLGVKLGEKRRLAYDANTEWGRAVSHPAGPVMGSYKDENDPQPYDFAAEYTMGGENLVNPPARSLIQMKKSEFGEDQRNFHTKHWSEGNHGEWSNLFHQRKAARPVMNRPTFFDDAGDEWRETSMHGDEPWQGDAGQQLTVEGMPKWNPKSSYGGLKESPSYDSAMQMELAKADVNRLEPEVDRLETKFHELDSRYRSLTRRDGDQNPYFKEAEALWGGWPVEFDRRVTHAARRLGHDHYNQMDNASSPSAVEARAALLREIENNGPLREAVDAGLWDSQGDNFKRYLELRDKPKDDVQEPDQSEIDAVYRAKEDAKNQYEALATQLTEARQRAKGGFNYTLHDNMPFVKRGSGNRERETAGIMNLLADAIEGGHENISISTMRGHGESYYYSELFPEPEARSRFREEPKHYYDSRHDRFMQTNGYPSSSNISQELKDKLKSAAPDYKEWLAQARDMWIEKELADLEDPLSITRERLIGIWNNFDDWDKDFQARKQHGEEFEDLAKQFAEEQELVGPKIPYDEPMGEIKDPEPWEYTTDKTPREMRSKDIPGTNARQTYGAGAINFPDHLNVKAIKRVLRDVLKMEERDIMEAFEDVEILVGEKSRTYKDQLFPNRKMRNRGIKVTPAVKDAWSRRQQGGSWGGLFGDLNPPPKPKKAKADKPNPGKIQKAYAAGKLSKEEAIEQLTAAGVPERAIANMIR